MRFGQKLLKYLTSLAQYLQKKTQKNLQEQPKNLKNNMNWLIKKYEGYSSKPYLCPAGVATIGYGTTVYPNGKKVSMIVPSIIAVM